MSDPTWRALILDGECPVCGKRYATPSVGPMRGCIAHMLYRHKDETGLRTSDEIRGYAGLPLVSEQISASKRRRWARLGPYERQATLDALARGRVAQAPYQRTDEHRAAFEAAIGDRSENARRQFLRMSAEQRREHMAPARAAIRNPSTAGHFQPGRTREGTLEEWREWGRRSGETKRLKRDRRKAWDAIDAIEARIRAEIRDPTPEERIDLRRLTRFLEETEA